MSRHLGYSNPRGLSVKGLAGLRLNHSAKVSARHKIMVSHIHNCITNIKRNNTSESGSFPHGCGFEARGGSLRVRESAVSDWRFFGVRLGLHVP